MALYAASFLLIPGILWPLIAHTNAIPTTYDQRQEGDFNVDAKFDNFLVLVATSGSSSLFNNLATQALELNELIGERSKTRQKPSEMMVYETKDPDDGREPYRVEIVRIEKEGDSMHPDKYDLQTGEKIQLATSLQTTANSSHNPAQISDSKVSIDSEKADKKAKSLWKNIDGHSFNDGSIEKIKKPVDIRNTQVENLNHSDDLPGKEDVLKAARPGISLKKQLSRKEEKEVSSISEERNELGNKYQELVLIGGGIENCGPGRYRDKLGICQSDKDFN